MWYLLCGQTTLIRDFRTAEPNLRTAARTCCSHLYWYSLNGGLFLPSALKYLIEHAFLYSATKLSTKTSPKPRGGFFLPIANLMHASYVRNCCRMTEERM